MGGVAFSRKKKSQSPLPGYFVVTVSLFNVRNSNDLERDCYYSACTNRV